MPLITVTHISKVFGDEESPTRALTDVSLSIEQGEFVAIIGPSGSGKSTLLQILGLLDRPSSGTYLFRDKNVDAYTDDEQAVLRNTALGFVFQSFNLLPRTSVLENVKLPLAYSTISPREWDAHARKQIEAVGLSRRMGHEPSQLSGGERQRVAIARALVNNPDIIFADEPTGNLDRASGENIVAMLRTLHEKDGHTIILITHDQQVACTAERIISLEDGKIIRDCRTDEYLSASV